MVTKQASAKSRYDTLKTQRQRQLSRAYECAKLTIPSLLPEENEKPQKNDDIAIEQPWQSIGAMGVNTLTAKMVLTLLPANSPFFMLSMGRKAREELLQLQGEEAEQFKAELEAGLQKVENEVIDNMETTRLRTNLFSVLKNLIVAGNALFNTDTTNCYSLRNYVVQRDRSGNATLIILREMVSKRTLPDRFVTKLTDKAKRDGKDKLADDLEIYTVVERKSKDRWESYQEVEGEEVPGTRGYYRDETNPWLALRMITVDGEDYGRSYVEELYGDLMSAEELTKAIVQGGMIASKLLWLVNPNGMTDIDDLQDAANGDFAPGMGTDVEALRTDKMADFQIAQQVLNSIEIRLERAFLMTASVQRDAERVTAFEIQVMSQEIEDVLGGYYSLMAQELQLPLVRRWMFKMQREGELPEFPEGTVEPVIVTGTDALGRGQDLTRLRGFAQDIVQLGQALPALIQRVNDGELLTRLANGHNIDTAGLIKTDQEIAAEQEAAQQQAMQQSMIDKGTGPAIQAMSQAAQAQQPQG